jgi:lincosamide and streptogramin A transport system ATP-binding/permease protein
LVLTQGNFGAYEQAKQRRDQTEASEQAQLKKDIGRLKQTAVKKRAWSASTESDKWGDAHKFRSGSIGDKGAIGAQAARVMQKAKNLEHRMDKEITSKEALLKNVEHIDPLALDYTPDHHQVLLRATNLTLSFAGVPLFKPVTFEVKRGERVALVGPNGVGKSSLIAAILAQAAESGTVTGQSVAPFAGEITGEIDLAQSASRALVRQLYPDNLGFLPQFAETRHLNYQNLHKLGVERSVFNVPIEDMSAGQQKKVELAASMATAAAFYIWDEPLNYLDVFNQDQLIQVIQTVKPTMLVTEHDQHFIDAINAKVVTLVKA